MTQVLRTERLILRPHELADFEAMSAMWADPAVVEHVFDQPQTGEETWSRLLRYRGHWALLGFGYWAVIDAETEAFLGEVGSANFHRGIEPSIDGIPEAGWVLSRAAHGRGIAREAMTAALDWMRESGRATQSVAIILPGNAKSITLAERLGYRWSHNAPYKGKDRLIYAWTAE
ncbi:MAG: GNAT family N-acetyltransferase [Pseudomonadota bacterium]